MTNEKTSAQAFFDRVDSAVSSVRPDVTAATSAAGLEAWNSGGGCLVWSKDLGDGTRLLVSTEAGLDGDPGQRIWMAGRYGEDDGSIDIRDLTLADALNAAGNLPIPRDAAGEPVQIAADSLDEAMAALAAKAGNAPGM